MQKINRQADIDRKVGRYDIEIKSKWNVWRSVGIN